MSNISKYNPENDPFKEIEFKGMSGLKPANTEVAVDEDMYKFYVQELIRCKKDPVYFAEKYYTIISPNDGKHIIKMYDKQKDLLKFMVENNRIVCLASRQTGKCVCKNSKITIRNKNTGKIEKLTFEEFENLIEKS